MSRGFNLSGFASCATVRELLKKAVVALSCAGVDTPALDADLLMMHHLKVDRVGLFMASAESVSSELLDGFLPLLERRMAREPLAYITGSTGFWDLELDVVPGVLVPRPDTETLIDSALAVLPPAKEKKLRMVDLGTGSGAIALSMASALPGHEVIATDRSEVALDTARKNAVKNGLEDAVTFVRGIWFEPFSCEAAVFDVILSNPPYIPSADIDALEPEVAIHEPRLALDGDADGLRDYRIIIEGCRMHLAPGGWLFLEMGFDQRDAVRGILDATGLFEAIDHINDYAGNNRVVRARRVE